jgi:hypothetical protein
LIYDVIAKVVQENNEEYDMIVTGTNTDVFNYSVDNRCL